MIFFTKWLIALVLLLTTIPTGCLPFLIVSGVQEDRAARASTKPWDAHRKRGDAWVVPAVSVVIWLIPAGASWAFWRRNQDDERPPWLGLSPGGWRLALWMSFSLGIGIGVWTYLDIR